MSDHLLLILVKRKQLHLQIEKDSGKCMKKLLLYSLLSDAHENFDT